jgi:DNA-binding transcriptional MerR regulator
MSSSKYTVKQLAELAGVSVRTLHLYDELGLLKPSVRTEAKYRLYGQQELLRLQQILFYKELDIPLQEIRDILDDPDFDLIKALEGHRSALKKRRERLGALLSTIDKTIYKLKGGKMKDEELYEGLPKEKADAWRSEAIEKYGEEAVLRSEKSLKSLGKDGLEALKAESEAIRNDLVSLVNTDPYGQQVQELIARHYATIEKYWGRAPGAEGYRGLAQLYVNDERFTLVNGKPNREYALFMQKAMDYYAEGLK